MKKGGFWSAGSLVQSLGMGSGSLSRQSTSTMLKEALV